eukprot:CAMPEP_0197603736 /NCGR_PEP_ID=MMETSP1326-20131121/39808_1 /TAXON_ID=1155430 /ORGANISM="Genus nov. species nov., Strain RCC2288" /LENGTH=182 /DNA_ID=CAMNT_0043171289 /DNA_START=221 /DNA_END=765 /DNA_ORIENTATION=+
MPGAISTGMMFSSWYPSALSAGMQVSSSKAGGPHNSATVLRFRTLKVPLVPPLAGKQCSSIIFLLTRPSPLDLSAQHTLLSACGAGVTREVSLLTMGSSSRVSLDNPGVQLLLTRWMLRELAPISDADPAVLSKYILALLKKDEPLDALRGNCVKELKEFLEAQTGAFVDKLFRYIAEDLPS